MSAPGAAISKATSWRPSALRDMRVMNYLKPNQLCENSRARFSQPRRYFGF